MLVEARQYPPSPVSRGTSASATIKTSFDISIDSDMYSTRGKVCATFPAKYAAGVVNTIALVLYILGSGCQSW